MKQLIKKEEMEKHVRAFQDDFYDKFGSVPRVQYKVDARIPELTLDDLDAVSENFIDMRRFPLGIRTKTRRRIVLLVRQCIFKLARDQGYTYDEIGIYFGGFDHATVIHSYTLINNLVDVKNLSILTVLNSIEGYIISTYKPQHEQKDKLNGDDGNVQSNNTEGTNS